MALTSKNQLSIAYKKLVGKTHTSAQAGAVGEAYASSVQVGSVEIFAQDPISKNRTVNESGTVTSEQADDILTRKVTFDLEPLGSSVYPPSIPNGDGELTFSGPHGYRLKFPSSDLTYADQFVDSQIKLQLVPPKYGNIYNAKAFSGTTPLYADGEQDWSLDYYSGIIFFQDLQNGQTPDKVEAYLYTGKYVSDILSSIGDVDDDANLLVKGQLERLEVRKDEDLAPQFSNLDEDGVPVTVATFSGSVGVSGDLEVNGTLHTKKLIVQETTEVVTKTNFANENIFGDSTSEEGGTRDTHTFYGDVNINGNLSVTGDGPNKKKVFEITRENAADDNGYISLNFDEPPIGLQDIKKGNLFLINTLDSDESTNDYIEIFLPDISNHQAWNGIEYTFKHMCGENHTVSISGADGVGQLIDGGLDVFLHAQYESITIVAYNGNWYIV